MKIKALTEFKSHGLWAKPGDVLDNVPDALGHYFVGNNWASENLEADLTTMKANNIPELTIDVQNITVVAAATEAN